MELIEVASVEGECATLFQVVLVGTNGLVQSLASVDRESGYNDFFNCRVRVTNPGDNTRVRRSCFSFWKTSFSSAVGVYTSVNRYNRRK